MREIPAEIVIH